MSIMMACANDTRNAVTLVKSGPAKKKEPPKRAYVQGMSKLLCSVYCDDSDVRLEETNAWNKFYNEQLEHQVVIAR